MKARTKDSARVALKVVASALDPFFGSLPGPRILIYHQVGVNLGRQMEVSIEAFAIQLSWIQANGEIVGLETAIERSRDVDANRLFVLSFDDGFEDVFLNAFPLMKELRVPFTLYLTTRPIETGEPLDPRYPEAGPLTWQQVNEMIASGLVTVGAHTHTHRDLRQATSEVIADELDISNEIILKWTGAKPMHFTYPWGWWSPTADRLVRERYASSTIGGARTSNTTDRKHLVPRVPVQRSDSAMFFKRRMKSGLRLEEEVRSLRSRYQ